MRVSVDRPVFDADVNILGTLQVLEGARAAGDRPGGLRGQRRHALRRPRPLGAPGQGVACRTGPLSPYGVSKKAAIDYLVAYRELHALEFCALALANVYGPRQDPHGEAGVVAIFAERLLRGEPVTIFGDGEQTRDFVYVDDVVDAFVRAASRGGGLVLQHRHRRRDVGQRALPACMAEAAGVVDARPCTRRPGPGELRRSCSRPRAGGDPARVAGLDRARRASAASSTTSGGSESPSWRRRSVGTAQRKRSSAGGRTISSATEARPQPRRVDAAHDGDRDSRSLPMTSSAAEAISSATHTSVASSSRPMASVVPRRSTTAATPGAPDGDVGHPLPPGPAEGVGHDHRHLDAVAVSRAPSRMRRAERSGSTGSRAAQPSLDVGQVDPGVGADEAVAGLGDEQVAAAAQHPHRLRLDECRLRPSGSSGSIGTRRPSALDTIFWVTTTTSPSDERDAACGDQPGQSRSPRSSPGRTSGMPGSGSTGDGSRRPEPRQGGIEHQLRQRRRRARSVMTVGATDAAHPERLDGGARPPSASSITRVPAQDA